MWCVRWFLEDRVYTVGFYDPKGLWHGCEEWASFAEAAMRINYLAGGSGAPMRSMKGGPSES